MASNKRTLLQGRLRPRIRTLGLSSYEQYFVYLTEHKSEIQTFINLVTTNETSFFRTQRVWDFFSKEFLPSWAERHRKEPLRIWSAAASSGEEVYTIAICCEEFRARNQSFSYQLLGTDISTNVLAIAEKGEYQGRSIDAFLSSNKQTFGKYLTPVGDAFRVADHVRGKIRFSTHNLFQQFPQANSFNIVFLRNVLIYFEPEDQEKVLQNVSRALLDNGTLVIGESESLSRLKTPFQFKSPLIYENRKGE